jgi:hypothetical protein
MPTKFTHRLTLYGRRGAVVAIEHGNNAKVLLAYALQMVAEGSASYWRLGNFPVG